MRSYKLLIILSLSIFLNTLFSQQKASPEGGYSPAHGKISGTLTFPDGLPVADALVFIQSLNQHVMSNENGSFELTKIPYGKYVLEVKTIEANPKKVDVNVNKRSIELSLVLEENSKFKLEEVVIVGKNEGRQLKEKGFSMNVLDMKALDVQSVQADELLDRTAGVRIRQSGGMGSQTNYNINGLSGSSVRIFIDGIPIRNYGASFSLSSIPPAQIERIEVYKGVVPAHLSEDALGGAINVVLKKTKGMRNRLSASYSYGSFNTHRGDVDGSYRNEKTGFTVEGSVFYNYTDNDYKVWGDQVYVSKPPSWQLDYITAERFHDSYESCGINANVGFVDVRWADRLTLGVLYSDMNKDVQNGGTMEVVYGNRRTGQDSKMMNLRYEKRDFLTKGLSMNAFMSYTHSNRWVVDTIPYIVNWLGDMIWNESANDYYQWSNGGGEQGPATLAKNKEKTIAGRANLAYRLHPQHRISANYFYNNFIRDVEDPLLPTAEQELTETRYLTKQIIGFTYENMFFDERLKTSWFVKQYIQAVKLKDPVKSNNMLSSVEYDETVNNTGYGFTASFAVLPKVLLQASYEKALRMPESNELLGNTSESVDATYDLKPEKSNNVNMGVILGTFDFNRHELRADVNFFIRDISDMIMRGTENSKTGTYGYENLGKVKSKGIDAEIGYIWHQKFFFTYNLSLFNARYKLRYDENGKEYSYYNDRLRNAPYFTMNCNAEYVLSNLIQKDSRTSFVYNFGYVHEFFKNWESIGGAGKAVIPTQNIHDLGVVYTFPKRKISLSFNAKNIFDEQVFDNWALQKPGRAFYGKISYRFL